MAHNINYNNKTDKYSFFSVKEKAWHNLGQIVDQYPTSAQAMEFAGLNFEVLKAPNRHTLPSGTEVISENSFFTFRTDTEAVLGDKLGRDYQIAQNKDVFTFFDSIVGGKDGILYETAGALGNGETVFITAKLPDYIRVGKDDCIEKYLFMTNTHDGSGSITAAFTPIRIVCNNTLNAAMRNHTNSIRIKHTANVQDRLKIAHRLMGISNQFADSLQDVFNHWSKVRVTDKQVKKLIQLAMSPGKETNQALRLGQLENLSSAFINTVEQAFTYAMCSPSQQQETTKGTLFGAYNSITGYYQNVCNFKDEEVKLKSIMYGTGLHRSQKAFDLCADFASTGTITIN